jgi:mRNA interferase MazF
MISSQVGQEIPGFDQVIGPHDPDFQDSGLKVPSLIRIGRLAVVNAAMLLGKIGRVDDLRMVKIKENLSKWILNHKEIEKA